MMLWTISLTVVLVILQPTLGQLTCKCGGQYANGKPVSGCVNGGCGNTANARCVIIYREKTPIGYDCLPWPTNVADCATFDDGSRVCASDVCKPPLLGGDKCAMEGDDGQQVLVAAQVSKAGLDFVMNAIKRQVGVEVAKLSIPDQKLQQSGFDVSVSEIKIAEFASPTFSYTLLPPSSVKLSITGGNFKVCAKWSAKKAFINPGGDICVWSEKQKGVNVQVTATIKIIENGHLRLSTSDCKLDVPIDMKLTGAVGTMVNWVSSWIENIAQNQANTQVCALIDKAVKTTVAKIIDDLPKHYHIDQGYGVAYSFRSLTVFDGGIRAQVAANGTYSGQ